MGVQRLEDTFSIIHKVLHPWLYIFGLGTKDGSVEWRVVACFFICKSLVLIYMRHSYPEANCVLDPSPQCLRRNITEKIITLKKVMIGNRLLVRCHDDN